MDKQNLKLYYHRGDGMAMASEVIVLANNKAEAKRLVRKELDNNGLSNVEVEIDSKGIPFKLESQVLHSWNGDY